MALKGARVSEYKGKSLNGGEDQNMVYIDPNHKRT